MSVKAPLGRSDVSWQWRNRGMTQWTNLDIEPPVWHLQMEYRALNRAGEEIWRSPHVNGYIERP